jgi:hypothetical protein
LAIKEKTRNDLIQIARAGGSVTVDARRYSLDDLVAIAQALTPESVLTLAFSESISAGDLGSILQGAAGKIVIS